MPLPLIPLTIATLAGGALWANSSKPGPAKGVVTTERTLIFETAMNELKDPGKLRKLADVYRKEGLPGHADLLEKRAKLRELPPDIKAARKAAYRKAMASTDAEAVRKLADAYDKEGATGAAASLRKYADSLKAATPPAAPAVPAVNPPNVPVPTVDAHPAVTPAVAVTPANPAAHGEAVG